LHAQTTRIGLIGFGAIAGKLAEVLASTHPRPDVRLAAVLVRRMPATGTVGPAGAVFTTALDHFLAQELDLVVECA
jgi:predicted dinucleotide-utilizing enzyme